MANIYVYKQTYFQLRITLISSEEKYIYELHVMKEDHNYAAQNTRTVNKRTER